MLSLLAGSCLSTYQLPGTVRRPPYGEPGRPNARAKKPPYLAKYTAAVFGSMLCYLNVIISMLSSHNVVIWLWLSLWFLLYFMLAVSSVLCL